MTPEQFELARPLIKRISYVKRAIEDTNKVKTWSDPETNHSGDNTPCHSVYLSIYKDFSGPSIDMTGCRIAHKVWAAIKKILKDELKELEQRLAEI